MNIMNKKFNKVANLIEKKDIITAMHSKNVASLMYGFALFLNKTKKEANILYIAGLFHDVGKLDVPDYILNKPTKLENSEFAIMQNHTEFSKNHLDDSYEEVIRNVAYGHHLAFDGTGYPVSLKGKNIPEECRIAAICDVYEALTAKRQYKEPFSKEKALSLIMQSTKLDPELVKKFVEFIQNII